MARIIDFYDYNTKKFWSWAREYVKIPSGVTFSIADILSFLVENKVFSLKEIEEDLFKQKIIIPQEHYDRAKFMLSCREGAKNE